MSTLVGIAIGEGTISGVNATLEDLLPEYRNQGVEPIFRLVDSAAYRICLEPPIRSHEATASKIQERIVT